MPVNKLQALIDQVRSDASFKPERFHPENDYEVQLAVWVEAEFRAVRDFLLGAEGLGIDTTVSPRAHYRAQRQEPFAYSNSPLIHDTLGSLAQHHGLPTRLLDWTRDPLTAAFFAAASVDANANSIAVFAVNPTQLKSQLDRPYVQFKPPIASKNDFLRSQQGLLSEVVNPHSFFLEHGRWPSFNEIAGESTVIRMTLPVEEAPELLRLLRREGYSWSRLMPTLESVTKDLFESWPLQHD